MARKPTGRPRGRPKGSTGTPAFARVQRARDALLAEAENYVQLHKKAATVAASRGNSQPAQWALEHISAADEKGKEIRPVGAGIDRTQIEAGSKAPVINIGWINAPGNAVEALPANVIDVKALPPHEG